MTKDEFKEIITVLQAGIGKTFSTEQNRVWLECLQDLERDHARASVIRWLCESENSFPTIGAIRRLAQDADIGANEFSGRAWERVCKIIRKIGNPIPEAAVRAEKALGPMLWSAVQWCGGWDSLCSMTAADRSIRAAQFKKYFEEGTERGRMWDRLPRSVRPRLPETEILADNIGLPGKSFP